MHAFISLSDAAKASSLNSSSQPFLQPPSQPPVLPPCPHCGQPVPVGRGGMHPPASSPQSAGLVFCCDGCETVYSVLQGAGLEQYYQVREALGERDVPAQVSKDRYEELDAPTFTQRYVRQTARGTSEVDLYLEGVHCAACVWLVEKLPAVAPGCVNARLDFTRARATLEWDAQKTPLSALARLLGSLGYKPHPWRQGDIAALRSAEDRRLWMRIGVAAAVVMNVMFLSIALYAGEYTAPGVTGETIGMDPALEQLFRWASLVVFLPSVLWSAMPFFTGAIASLRSGVLHMDLPLSIGISVGFVASAWRVVAGSGDIYFDSLAMLICLLLVARWFQRKGQRAAGEAAELLQALTSTTARVLQPAASNGDSPVEKMTSIDALLPGMQVKVLSGESIPADGMVLEGHSFLDRAVLSGEAEPVSIGPGEQVFAGTVNLQSPLVILLTATGEETRVGKLMRMMEEASARRAPIVAMADRITGYFVATVLVLAVLTGVGWTLWGGPLGGPALAIEHVVALLIVTCPCALGMATPVALAVAMGRAARQGVMIKGGDAVERLARARHILLDKTGTLTEGKLRLTFWVGSFLAQQLLVSLERASGHPLAKAVQRGMPDTPACAVDRVQEVLGGGLISSFEGLDVRVGSPAFIARTLGSRTMQLTPELKTALDDVLHRAQTPVLVALAGEVIGVAGFGDPLRADTLDAIAALKSLGFRVGILSGDHPAVVSRVGELLGLDPADVHGGLSPEQKLAYVEKAIGTGEVVMVGDGVNDAAALSAASVGISVHGGAEASLAAADVFLSRPGLLPVVECIEGARATLGVVRRNLIFSVGYNLLGAALAMAGLMGPLLAALLMPFSSGTVVGSSLVRGGFRPTQHTHRARRV